MCSSTSTGWSGVCSSTGQTARRRTSSWPRSGGSGEYTGRTTPSAATAPACSTRSSCGTCSTAGDAADGYRPDLDGPLHSMPMGLKLAIASRVAAGRPLPFELAMAGLFGLEPGLLPFSYPVLAHARPQLLELMRPKFEAACPLGFKLANRKDSKLHLSHRCATAGLVVDIGASADGASLPDPASLTWTKLIKLVEPVAAELEPFAKMKAYRPARVASLSVFTALPGGIASDRGRSRSEGREGLGWSTLPKPIARVGFAELAQRALGETSAKWTLRHHRAVGEALASTAYGVEPHPDQGGLAIANDTSMFVFRDPAAGRERTSSFRAAAVGAEVVAAVSRVHPGTASAVSRTWLSRIGERLPLEPDGNHPAGCQAEMARGQQAQHGTHQGWPGERVGDGEGDGRMVGGDRRGRGRRPGPRPGQRAREGLRHPGLDPSRPLHRLAWRGRGRRPARDRARGRRARREGDQA